MQLVVVTTAFVPVNSFSSTVVDPPFSTKRSQWGSCGVSRVFSTSVEVVALCEQPAKGSGTSGVSAKITLVGASISAIRSNARAFGIFSGYQQLGELPTGRGVRTSSFLDV